MELKHIDISKGEFTANGVNYLIRYSLTVERWKIFEKLQNHFAFGLAFSEIVRRLDQAIDFANKGKGVEAWNVIYNLKEGIAYRLEDREHPTLLLLTLFIITENEDITTWSEEDAKIKVMNWNKEGYDVNDFFSFAANLVPNFLPVYGEIFQSISPMETKVKSKPTSK
jgi:hypothetical protein